MSEPTPTLDEIKSWYAGAVDEYRCDSGMSMEEGERAFDRAIAAHDTVLREQIAAEIAQRAHSRDDLMRVVRAGGSTDWVTGWDAATFTATKIARGES